ncbi:hypothetical protein Tco_0405126 [Tanacetum coccineum]
MYVTPSYTKKVFGNIKRGGKGFSGRVTPLFPAMMVQAQQEIGEELIADAAANEENVPTHSNNPLLSGSDVGTYKDHSGIEIKSLKRRVNKLEKKQRSRTPKLKRLFKVGKTAQVVSSKDEVTLVDETHGRYDDAQMFDTDVFNGEEVITENELVEKSIAKLRSAKPKVVIQEPVQSTATTVPSTIPKAKSITFRDPDESTTRPTLTPIPSNIKDKGKSKMIKPEKPLKKTKQIRLDEELAFKLQAEEEEKQELCKRDRLKEVKRSQHVQIHGNCASNDMVDRLLAERLQAREQEELIDEEKARLFVELLEKKKKHVAALRAQEKRNKPPTKAQKKSTMSSYLKHMAGYKQSQLKNKSFVEIQKLLDKAMTRVNMFVDKDTELVKESSKKAEAEMAQESSYKRAGEELEQEVAKKQKMEEDKEKEDLKQCFKIVQDDEVAIDAIPLATKHAPIINFQIHRKGRNGYYEIMRAGESAKTYLLFS